MCFVWMPSWPCAFKGFRNMEKTLWCIGKERPVIDLPSFPLNNPEEVPDFLLCRDTYPNQDDVTWWWDSFLAALRAWWRGEPVQGPVGAEVERRLGEPTPIKRWLVRLLVRRLEVLAEGHLKPMVNPPSGGLRGTGKI